jgi:hypothetical protein
MFSPSSRASIAAIALSIGAMIVEISGVEKVVNFWCSLFGVHHAHGHGTLCNLPCLLILPV